MYAVEEQWKQKNNDKQKLSLKADVVVKVLKKNWYLKDSRVKSV